MKRAALALGLPVHQPERWKAPETRALWESLAIDLAVVVAYGHLLPSWMLDSCPLGVWNLHFSLLPRWRGAAPVNHAILAGDAGDRREPHAPHPRPGRRPGPGPDPPSRHPAGHRRRPPGAPGPGRGGPAGGPAARPGGGTRRPPPQDAALATLAPKLDKAMARLDPGRPAADLHRQVRALQPWPGTELELAGTL